MGLVGNAVLSAPRLVFGGGLSEDFQGYAEGGNLTGALYSENSNGSAKIAVSGADKFIELKKSGGGSGWVSVKNSLFYGFSGAAVVYRQDVN